MQQIWLRHKNGNGRVYGNSALVTPDTFLDRGSSVGDDAEVYGATIIRSAVTDRALVSQSHVEDSLISDDSRALGGVILNSTLSGYARTWGNPSIADCALRNAFVYEGAIVEGVTLDAFVRIHIGEWHVAPRWEVISSPGILVEVTISECAEGRAHIGCYCRTYDDWFRPGYRQMIGKRSGWTPAMVEECFQAFKGWR